MAREMVGVVYLCRRRREGRDDHWLVLTWSQGVNWKIEFMESWVAWSLEFGSAQELGELAQIITIYAMNTPTASAWQMCIASIVKFHLEQCGVVARVSVFICFTEEAQHEALAPWRRPLQSQCRLGYRHTGSRRLR